jgi:hypothetical protein
VIPHVPRNGEAFSHQRSALSFRNKIERSLVAAQPSEIARAMHDHELTAES